MNDANGNVNLVLYDMEMKTYTDRTQYAEFVKKLKGCGYSALQKSVYCKHFDTISQAKSSIRKITSFVPPNAEITMLTITEKNFSEMIFINAAPPKIKNDRIIVI